MKNIKGYYKDSNKNVYLVKDDGYKKNNKWIDEEIPKHQFIQIKKHEYQELLNLYFSKTKETWEFEGELFRKLDNFEVNSYENVFNKDEYWCLNYQDLPTRKTEHYEHNYLVYYQGQLYTTIIQGNYFPRTMLYKLNHKFPDKIKWTNLKNCSPIFNINKKEII